MTQSLSQLYVHIIFHVKNNGILIRQEDEPELYAYIGGIISRQDSFPIQINGMEDHLHILSSMSKNISLAKYVEEIKKSSSKWMKTKSESYNHFAWQGGYAGYSVSQTKIAIVKKYIQNQKEHHKTMSFKDEYIKFLKNYKVDFNESYVFQ
ncbi:MAG: transposase [Planctomycetaceae bacterium]|nr:transposase [Planctomycetaceae bacterium]